MIVFPLRRSVGLKAATASSRVETLPMFVRSRASRTRAERPIPGDRVLDAFDRALIGAHGAALDLVAAYLSRAGTLEADESGRTPGILAVTAAEGGPNALCLSWRRSGPDSQPYPRRNRVVRALARNRDLVTDRPQSRRCNAADRGALARARLRAITRPGSIHARRQMRAAPHLL